MTATEGAWRESVVVPDGRWVSLESMGLLILDKDKGKTIYDHRCP